MSSVPGLRIRSVGGIAEARPDGDYVLYWMVAFRRTGWNFSLQHAVEWARRLNRPLVVLEALRCGYRWASDRLHAFVIQGMAENSRRLARKPVLYYPYVEPQAGAGHGLLAALAARACVVISDDFPCFFLPRTLAAAAAQIPVRFELVDSNGLLPLRAADRVFVTAYQFRRFLQKHLPAHLSELPAADPLARVRLPSLGALPDNITARWPATPLGQLARHPARLAALPIDHSVPPVATAGGARAAERSLRAFLDSKLAHYADRRNQPEEDVASGLSPYLHFGHIAAQQVFAETMAAAGWTADQLASRATGSAQGWWGAPVAVESFVDQLTTWRELGHNLCWQRADYDQYPALPDWARRTLAKHASDQRQFVYSLEQFENAATHDPLWNAAQRQLLREGRMHNYLRMLWGKKILEWSSGPEEALEVMIELNNRYALDGRDPNSSSGIFWVLGRYDHPWAPERPVFGTVRYMSSANTARKVRVRDYLQKYGPASR
jgi:deoxyribodipyrimidine photo-lyase